MIPSLPPRRTTSSSAHFTQMGELIEVKVTKRRSLLDTLGTQYTSYASDDATLVDLRRVLEDDGIMASDERFYVDGRALGKSAEARLYWRAILAVSYASLCNNRRADDSLGRRSDCCTTARRPTGTDTTR